ncbi:MAG TPA: hypothetical protein EYP80_02130 [Candidatus Aenigmarchaeota archaeon]|nr:hypothetical protein [Candidatus Aenigmarchaeota archaeon]
MGRIVKKLLILFILLLPVRGEVIHDLNLNNNYIEINSTLILHSKNYLDYWEITIPLQEDSKVISVQDDIGKIHYNFSNNELIFRTNNKRAKTRIINIMYEVPLKREYDFLFVNLNLFGFENETYVVIAPNFQYFFIPNAEIEYGSKIKAKGRGALEVKILFGGKNESKHYFTNSNFDLDKVEYYFWILESITGLKIPTKFGILILPKNKYKGEFEEWSSGTFKDGLIVVREDLDEDEKIATIMHETMHGFNSFVLDWDATNISWFDEGTATYVSSIMFRILNQSKPEIFGESIIWREGNKIYTLEPNQKPVDLWNYYKKNENWMLFWNPRKYSDWRREFGYAYSELFIRDYLKDNATALRRVYKELLKINKIVENSYERNQIIQKILGKEFRPCYSLDLEEIRNCTYKLNKMKFVIEKNGKKIDYKVEIPELPKEEVDMIYKITNFIIEKIREIYLILINFLIL